jgi:hypothetical protein
MSTSGVEGCSNLPLFPQQWVGSKTRDLHQKQVQRSGKSDDLKGRRKKAAAVEKFV